MKQDASASECRRCGICCRKGGPSLHREDNFLIEEGRISLEHLYVIREGEPVYDNVRERRHRAARDIIKIKDREDPGGCVFLDGPGTGCTRYEDRPLECRVLKCWDTREIEAVYSRGRLVRRDLVGGVKGLWDLIRDHQERCDPRKIESLALQACRSDPKARNGSSESIPETFPGISNDSEAVAELNRILQYDLHLREIIAEDGGIHPDRIEFLLGRPLWRILRPLGVDIRREGERFVWMKTEDSDHIRHCLK